MVKIMIWIKDVDEKTHIFLCFYCTVAAPLFAYGHYCFIRQSCEIYFRDNITAEVFMLLL